MSEIRGKYPRVIVLGYSEAGMFLRTPVAADLRGVITIYGQREYPLDVPDVDVKLVLEFDDSEAPGSSDLIHAARVRLRQRQAAEIGLRPRPPTADHAESIIDFARSTRDVDGVLLCQCHAGISRSPAAALLCLAAWTCPGFERECVSYLLEVRPAAVPHMDLIRFGDELLGLENRLVDAVSSARP